MMLSPLRNRSFAILFAAQVIALLGTGLMTVALGLLAHDLAGARVGVVGFLGSAALVLTVTLAAPSPATRRPFVQRLTRGMRIYLATPRLRGLLALNLTAAAAGAFVIVNTVVLVREVHGGADAAASPRPAG